MKTVLVIPPTFGVEHDYSVRGYNVIVAGDKPEHPPEDIDLVSFMGGVDINPELYGEERIPETQTPSNGRDAREIAIYNYYKDVPKVGICRGAQLLNVLNGGKLWQHVNNHASGAHPITDKWGRVAVTSSVHHQQMIPAPNAEVIAWANPMSTVKKRWGETIRGEDRDIEILWIKDKKELLFQGHPEFGPRGCTEYFFRLVDELIWEKKNVS